MRRTAPLVLLLLSLALGPTGGPAAGVARAATSPSVVAARDAASLLKLLHLPPGATALRRRPSGVMIRPASERVPSAAKAALVTVTPPLSGPGAKRPAAKSIEVSAPGQVAQLVAAVDSLPAAQPGAVNCPADDGATVSIAFRASPRGAVLALARADLTGCGEVSFALGGRIEPALTDGPALGSAVHRILGVAVPRSW